MLEPSKIAALGDELYAALRARQVLDPLTARESAIDIDDAYRISLHMLKRREAAGERIIGKKIGVTSKPVQDMLNVRQPDFGFLTDVMEIPDGGTAVIADGLIQPRAEAEIAFMLKSDLKGPGISMQDVLDATDYIMPCFEIVDSRIADWKIKIADTVADNASCGVFVLGTAHANPHDFDLAALKVTVTKNGAPLSEGYGSAVQGSPLAAVAWLANTLGPYGVTLNAGDIVLSGSLVPLEPARPGDIFTMDLSGVGATSIRFA
jgi:2-oxopent-4-enoate/cis-2-oxohex-4-enoate hydratase